MVTTPTSSTKYIGVYSGTSSTVPAYTAFTWSKYVGDNGTNGVSVTQTRELYYLKTNSTTVPTITASSQITATDRQNGWTSIVPTYVANAEYWTCIETSLSSGGPVWSTPVLNNALTDESYKAWEALSIAQHANEDAQGAMSQAAAANVLAEGLQTKLKYMWVNENNSTSYPAGSYMASGNNSTFDSTNSSTYGFNSFLEHTKLHFRYNAIDLDTIGLDGLRLYAPTVSNNVITGSQLGMELTSTALKLYRPGTATVDAQLDSNGLKITNGSIVLGSTGGTAAGNITLSNSDFSRDINDIPRDYLRLAIGSNFGVKNDGTLYASNAIVSGKIIISGGIGGKNLLNDTATMIQKTSGNRGFRVSGSNAEYIQIVDTDVAPIDFPIDGLTGIARVTNTSSSAQRIGFCQDELVDRFIAGEEYTFSIWVRASTANLSISLQPIWASSSQAIPGISAGNTTTTWTKYTVTGTLQGTQASSYSAGYIYVQNVPANGWIECCGLKLERGSIVTDWTPSSEDVDTSLDVVNENINVIDTSLQSNISEMLDAIAGQDTQLSNISQSIEANSTLINSNGDAIKRLQEADTTTNTEILRLKTETVNLSNRASTLEGAVVIDESEPSVSVVSGNSSVKITNDKIVLKNGNNNMVAWGDSESFNAQTGTFTEIRPRTISFNGTSATVSGNLVFSARSDGHFTLKSLI
jgi:hypothetical protein